MNPDPIEKVLSALNGVKRCGDTGRQWVALCPNHDDSKHSLTIGVTKEGKVLLKCYAGCDTRSVVSSLGMEWGDLFPQEADETKPQQPVTLKELAWDKRIPIEFLRSCGLSDFPGEGVHIPYYDADMRRLETKIRTRLTAKHGSFWPKGKPLLAYGIWKLKDFRDAGRLVIVEGESDCWTLWHHGLPGLGLPGASAIKTLTNELLAGIKNLFVWQEHGVAGEQFVAWISKQLLETNWVGTAKVISGGPIKDPNALHQMDPEEFKKSFTRIIDAAKAIPKPKVSSAERKKSPPKTITIPGQVAATAEAIKAIPTPAPGFYGMTDSGNAERLNFRHGKDLRFCHIWNKWLIWDGRRWDVDTTGGIYRRTKDAVMAIYAEAERAESTELKAKLMSWAVRSESLKNIEAMIRLVRNEMAVPVKPEQLDADPWKFNILNGTVDLLTGKLMPHRRDDNLTKLAHVEFDEAATCPVWIEFLRRIMGDRDDLVRFLQLAIGYSLTGVVSEKCFFFLYGTGDNGKSTLVECLRDLMGNYWIKTVAETVLSRSHSGAIPNDVARLVGVRMVSTAELPEGRQLDEAKVKDLTGRDTISARFMRAEWFDFNPIFKLWMYGNHKPTIKGSDEGIWRRVRLIPFDVTIPKSEQDEQLPEKLKSELPGILNWAIAGCLAWQCDGLPVPSAIREATEDYRSDMDVIAAFLADCCMVAENAKCWGNELYSAYKGWCRREGEEPVSQKELGAILKDRGFKQYKNDAIRGWRGISIRDATRQTIIPSEFDD